MSGAALLGRRAAVIGFVFVASAMGSRAVVARLVPPPPPPALPDPRAFNYEAAAERFAGQLSGPARRHVEFTSDTALVVLLRQADLASCEDLGRQLRELKRAYGPRRSIHVFTDSTHAVETYLRRERIGRVRVRALDPASVMGGGRAVTTPAVLLASRDGTVLQAVSHVRRAPNVRLQSFAQELNLALPVERAKPGPAAPTPSGSR